MFTTVIITAPGVVADEARRVACFLDEGKCDYVHIRKPSWGRDAVEALIQSIPKEWHRCLVLHDRFELATAYGLHGVHVNSRNPVPPVGFTGSVSRSLHSIEEVARWKAHYTFVSLSPLFDSISKQGYRAAFTPDELAAAKAAGIIDEKVFALGGITFQRLPVVQSMGFGGAMLLGDAWK
ncbi:MAG: thiamine phosphate synthase [Prevotellaceae bacterium]|nr:thiamine phosphate synthase [Prevotellaceae bacterium]